MFISEWKDRTDKIFIFSESTDFLKSGSSVIQRYPLSKLETFTSKWDLDSDCESEMTDSEKVSQVSGVQSQRLKSTQEAKRGGRFDQLNDYELQELQKIFQLKFMKLLATQTLP